MIEFLSGMAVLVVVAAGIMALVRRMHTTRRVTVREEVFVGGSASVVDPAVQASLSAIGGVELVTTGPGRHILVLRRTPVWVVAPVVLLFPVGLVFLFVKDDLMLDITVHDGPHGAVLRVDGRSEEHVVESLRRAVTGLVPAPPPRVNTRHRRPHHVRAAAVKH